MTSHWYDRVTVSKQCHTVPEYYPPDKVLLFYRRRALCLKQETGLCGDYLLREDAFTKTYEV